jgi:hypothetical protein
MAPGETQQRQPEQYPGDLLEQIERSVGAVELVVARDLEVGDVGRQLVDHVGRQAGPGRYLPQHLSQVERDGTVGHIAADDRQQRVVRDAIGFTPRVQGHRVAEQPRSRPPDKLLQAGGGLAGQAIDRWRQGLPQALRHGVLGERVDEEQRQRVADLLVLEQLAAGVNPVVAVERLPLGPTTPARNPSRTGCRRPAGR